MLAAENLGHYNMTKWPILFNLPIAGGKDGLMAFLKILAIPCLPSRKLSKLDEPDTQDTAGEAETNS